jgi:hypothetical protein
MHLEFQELIGYRRGINASSVKKRVPGTRLAVHSVLA